MGEIEGGIGRERREIDRGESGRGEEREEERGK